MLKDKLQAAEKRLQDPRPAEIRLTTCRGFLGRQQKRIEQAKQEMASTQARLEALQKELHEQQQAEQRLVQE
eukprot:8963050-Prorocentrum_lima.AAC.1